MGLFKGLVIYLIFIIGVAIISEYICLKTKFNATSNEAKIDRFLAELKEIYLKKLNQEEFTNYSEFQRPMVSTEDPVLCEVAKKLDSHSNSEVVTINSPYSEIPSTDDHPITSKFTRVKVAKPGKLKVTFDLPETKELDVDSKHIFSFSGFDSSASRFASINLK